MTSSWSVFILATVVVTLLVLQAQLGESRSDNALEYCRNVCFDENVAAEECEITQCSSDKIPSRWGRRRCRNRCFRNATRCWGFCRNKYDRVMNRCRPRCIGDDYLDCMDTCFFDRMLTMRTNRFGPGPAPPTFAPAPPTFAPAPPTFAPPPPLLEIQQNTGGQRRPPLTL